MLQHRLRQKPRISYQELEEPSFDEYIYCEKCGDSVYEYCSIHGPLLVIPDNKVPEKTNSSLDVARATLTLPDVFLNLGPSSIPGAGLGIFATLTLPCGVRFGPYRGRCTKQIDSAYCWQVYDCDNKPSHTVDGSDSAESNWMRYVNCARHHREQNLVAYQYQGDIYYRTIKIIPRSTELLVFYGIQYAEALQIDLGKYNSKNHYHAAIGLQPPALEHSTRTTEVEVPQDPDLQSEHISTTTLEIARAGRHVYNRYEVSEDFEIEDFHYIDDAIEDTTQRIDKDNQELKVEFNSQKQCYEIEFHSNSERDNEFNAINDTQVQNIVKTKLDKLQQVYFKYEDNTLTASDNLPSFASDAKKQRLDETLHRNNEDQGLGNKYNNGITEYSKTFTQIVIDKAHAWKCNVCQKILNSRTSLKKHARIHVEVKSHKCTVCEYSTHYKSTFERHVALHKRKFEYKCELCSFATHSGKNLNKHVQRMHVNRPSCDLCHYKTNSKINLEHHRSLHGKNNVMKCYFCDYLCNKRKYLKRHVTEVHASNLK